MAANVYDLATLKASELTAYTGTPAATDLVVAIIGGLPYTITIAQVLAAV